MPVSLSSREIACERSWRDDVARAHGLLLRTLTVPVPPGTPFTIRLYVGCGPSHRSFVAQAHFWLCIDHALKRNMRTTYDWIEIVSMDERALRGWTSELQLFESVTDDMDTREGREHDVRA